MPVPVNGEPFALAVVLLAGAIACWHYKKLHRLSALLFGSSAFLLAVSVIPWRNALASLVVTGTGLTVLAITDVVTGLAFWHEVIRKHMHHRIRTPTVSIIFGTALVLTIGDAGLLLRKLAQSPTKASAALGKAVTRIQSGHAHQAAPSHHSLVILGIGVALLILLILAGHRRDRGSGRGTPAALPPGRGGAPARRPLPAPARRR